MAKTTTTVDTIKTQLTTATKPLYAGVGVTDLAAARVREYVAAGQKRLTEVQKDMQKSLSDLDLQPQALRDQAVTVVTTRFDAAVKDAKTRRTTIEKRVAELQTEAQTYPAKVQAWLEADLAAAGETYADLVKRGETLVGRIRGQESTQATAASAKQTVTKAKTTTTQAKKTASTAKKSTKKATSSTKKATAKKAGTAKSSAKATATSAGKAAADAARATSDAAGKVGA